MSNDKKVEKVDMLELLPEPEKDNFKFQNQKCMLTYKTHLDKQKFIEFISKKIKRNPKFIRVAHENGEGDSITPYEHSHVLIDFGKRVQTTSSRYFDYEEIHPNIKKVTTKGYWENCKNYIAKEDPDCIDLKSQSSELVLHNLGNCETQKEALLKCLGADGKINWSHVNGIKTAYEIMKEPVMPSYEEPTLEWQFDLIKELDTKPDSRKIVWYYDPIGRSGKSQLARYLEITSEQKILCTKDLGTERDAATIIGNAIGKGWKSQGIIIDVPRSAESDKKRIYTYLESIKDGHCTATKYEGANHYFEIPHVVVFANWLPIVETLSMDRWDIREITSEKQIIKLNAYELRGTKDNICQAANILMLMTDEDIEKAIKLSRMKARS